MIDIEVISSMKVRHAHSPPPNLYSTFFLHKAPPAFALDINHEV